MNLVRSLNKYHGGIADRISIMAKSAYVGSHTTTHKSTSCSNEEPTAGFSYKLSEWGFYGRVYLLQFTNWILRILYGKYVDDFVEDEQVKNSQEMF